jgi:hypothetical protein
MDLLETADTGSSQDLNDQIISYLNRWAFEQPAAKDWKPTALLEQLQPEFRNIREISAAALAENTFSAEDVSHLQQSRQLKLTGKWVTRKPTPDYLAEWAKQKGLSADAEQQLFAAERIFDWTVRNVQLSPLRPHPDRNSTGPTTSNQRKVSGVAEAIVGPGYMHRPMETLLYGKGDMLERAQVFILAARQQGLNAVMLAVLDKDGKGSYEPWLPALLIDDELYLFDTQLGLPIPDQSGQGVATLSEVLADNALLRSLDMSEELTYRVANKQLEKVHVLLNISPAAMSMKMRQLQRSLTGETQLALYVDADQQHEQFARLEGIDDVALWTISLENILYLQGIKDRVAKDRAIYIRVSNEQRLFRQTPQLSKGRVQQISGHFDGTASNMNERAVIGAKELLLAFQMSHKRLMALPRDDEFLKANGLLLRDNETPQQQLIRIQSRVFDLIRANQQTSFWIAGVHFETENYTAAARWFENRVLDDVRNLPGVEEPLTNPWAFAARYNIGRCHEALGNTEDAQRFYRADTSAQKHGCLLRARQLRQRTEAKKAVSKEAVSK